MNGIELAIYIDTNEFDKELDSMVPQSIRNNLKLYELITEGDIDRDNASLITKLDYRKDEEDVFFNIKLDITPYQIEGIFEADIDDKSYREIKYKPVKFELLNDLLKEMIKNIK